MTSAFQFDSYRAFLQAKVRASKDQWGLLTRLAEAAGCQRPYLSRVFKGDAHFTGPQVLGLARFWELAEDETEYLLGLLELEKAGTAAYRDYWQAKLTRLKRNHENLSRLVARTHAGHDERDVHYYSSWHWTAIHILVSIPEFQTERAIAERLGLPAALVASTLQTLESWGAVRREKNHWKFLGREQHIGKDSPLSVFHHTNWRNRAMAEAQHAHPESVHYTVVQSLSRQDFARLRRQLLEWIQNAAAVAGPSKEEKLLCITCDFFEV